MNNINGLAESLCCCGSGLRVDDCCLAIIKGIKQAQTAEQLMRSRYSAFVMCNESYLLDSWYRETRPEQITFDKAVIWTGLKVLQASIDRTSQDEKKATVEFIASFKQGLTGGNMHEISRFIYENGDWFYIDGQQIKSKKPARNSPCLCGSGKKYKKCCGG